MNQSKRGTAFSIGWSLVGLALGFLAGVAARDRLGTPSSRRTAGTPPAPVARVPRRPTAGSTKRLVEHAIAQDGSWDDLEIVISAVSPGVIELRGWVSDRLTRARLIRFVRAIVGVDRIIDSLLVRGEDDRPDPPEDEAHQTA